MENLRPSDLRPDPLLMQWALVYGTGGGFVQDEVSVNAPVSQVSIKYATYKMDQLNTEVNDTVAPGDTPNQVRTQKPSFDTASLVRRALDDNINDEVAKTAPNPAFIEQRRFGKLIHNLRLAREARVLALLNAGSHSTNASATWDAGSGVEIEKDIDNAREAFVKQCGFEANTLIIPAPAAKVAKRDSKIRDLRRYTDSTLLVNGDLPPDIFGLRTIIPGAIRNTGNPKSDFSQTIDRVWSTKTAYLLYIDQSAASTDGLTALKSFNWSEWGTPFAGYRWRDPHQSKRVTWLSAEYYGVEKTVCDDAIYRITAVLA